MSRTTLIVSNDFPPSIGGIEAFVRTCCELLDGDVVVLTREQAGSAAVDIGCGFPVHRIAGPLLPTARVGEHAVRLLRHHGATRVIFGAAAPLGLLAPRLRAAGAERQLAISHGHEVWWATLPGSRRLLRRIGDGVDAFGVIADFTAARIVPALSATARSRVVRLPPPVDTERFRPGSESVTDQRPVVLAAARLVRRKGIETLIEAWRLLRRDQPELPGLLRIVGGGPERTALERRAAGLTDVEFAGVRHDEQMPGEFTRAAVFAAPSRTRLGGLNSEGLGLAMLEAASCGLPVLVGRSGGAPETVTTESGLVLPDDPRAWAAALAALLADPARRAAMGAAGRVHVQRHFGTAAARRTLRTVLALE